jgi:ABC-2 type transport system permease protein
MVNAFRFGFLGHSDVDVGISFAIMLFAMLALFGSCVWLLERGTGTRE